MTMINNEQNPQLEALIERVVCGDLAIDSAEIKAAIAGNPDFQIRLDEMLDLQMLLANDSGEMNAVLAEVVGHAQPQQTAAILPGPWYKRHLASLVAAAAVIMIVIAVPFGDDNQSVQLPGQGQSLGNSPSTDFLDEIPTPLPQGASSSFEVFRYLHEPVAIGQRLQIRIWAAGSSLDSLPVLELPIFEGFECTLTPSQVAMLPNAIQWRVDVWGLGGDALGRSKVFLATR